ncbi:hypothetical protein SBV1_2630017 [Verrucomicrobia bacterium]|nr:hypothetical protein SBV1_2630017 [Verrucomicrobiota bacterium]
MSKGSDSSLPSRAPTRLVCFVNGIYANEIGGGDVYFAHLARGVLATGRPLHFFGGHVLKEYLERQGLPLNLTLTDRHKGNLGDVTSLRGQFRLLFDFVRRCFGTLRKLGEVRPEDYAYAMSDFWFDAIPLVFCRARVKILYLGMMAPTLWEVISRGRPDVPASRLASLYYWLSQQISFRLFRLCRQGQVTYSHPDMKRYLQRFGYPETNLTYVPNGMDVAAADAAPERKEFDVVWAGRVHPQKGVDDLLATLEWLGKRLPDFRAVIIGRSKTVLEPKIRQLGLSENVVFTGLVSEAEKFRTLKASRVFVMPSRYESWGIVVGEALASGIPVVAYELECYRPVFGAFARYVKPFERQLFAEAVEREVREMRAGRNYLSGMDLASLKRELSWSSAQAAFCKLLGSL